MKKFEEFINEGVFDRFKMNKGKSDNPQENDDTTDNSPFLSNGLQQGWSKGQKLTEKAVENFDPTDRCLVKEGSKYLPLECIGSPFWEPYEHSDYGKDMAFWVINKKYTITYKGRDIIKYSPEELKKIAREGNLFVYEGPQ
jgi:hypothetical protein